MIVTDAARLLFGIIPTLMIAGTIEGFFSSNYTIPDAVKYLVGTGLFVLLVLYCSRHKGLEARNIEES